MIKSSTVALKRFCVHLFSRLHAVWLCHSSQCTNGSICHQ